MKRYIIWHLQRDGLWSASYFDTIDDAVQALQSLGGMLTKRVPYVVMVTEGGDVE